MGGPRETQQQRLHYHSNYRYVDEIAVPLGEKDTRTVEDTVQLLSLVLHVLRATGGRDGMG